MYLITIFLFYFLRPFDLLHNLILQSKLLLQVFYLPNQLMKLCGPFTGFYVMTGPIRMLNKKFFFQQLSMS